jgi:shikimate kinase
MKTIVLTGMMGAGKTTVAQFLSKELSLEFIDIDSFIENQEGLTISEIFAQKGEEYFRNLETSVIETIFNSENQVISLGGGALENPKTREFLKKNSNLIYLKTSPTEIFERIKSDASRPLLRDKMSIEHIEKILNMREKNYQEAHYTIQTNNKLPINIAREIVGVLQK